MSGKIERFGLQAREILKADPGPAGIERLRAMLEPLLVDREVVETHLGPDNDQKRTVLYEDPELGFLILAHVFKGSNEAQPHDHGSSWAIYGQVDGVTEMTEYDRVAPPAGDVPGKARAVKSYRMKRGDAVAYPVGALHSPRRTGETRLIRLEGADVTRMKRDRYERI